MRRINSTYAFAPLGVKCFPSAGGGFREPLVLRWWVEGIRLPYPEAEIEEYRAALHGEPTYRYVAHVDGRPVGMFQHYRIGDSPEYAAALGLDEEAVGADLFIGEADLVGRGHGPAMLRAFLRDVAFPFHQLETCVIGPSVKNTSAIRAYEKAGFTPLRLVQVPDEPDSEYLMRLTRSQLDSLH